MFKCIELNKVSNLKICVQSLPIGFAVCWKGAVPNNLCGFTEGGRGLSTILYDFLLTLQY